MSAETSLRDRFEHGLNAPICLTWELTYACNLACTHCLSSSGRRDPRELSTDEAVSLLDEIAAMSRDIAAAVNPNAAAVGFGGAQ